MSQNLRLFKIHLSGYFQGKSWDHSIQLPATDEHDAQQAVYDYMQGNRIKNWYIMSCSEIQSERITP